MSTVAQSSQELAHLAELPFVKMTGSGNDFILVDNRTGVVAPGLMPLLAQAVCARRRSAGADGLVLLRGSDRVDPKLGPLDFAWDFFNSDGSSAEMCGNAGRCAARLAVDLGMADASGMVFETLAGPIRAWVGERQVKLEMVPPAGAYQDLSIKANGEKFVLDGVNTGVPHAVLTVEDLAAAEVVRVGRLIRRHEHFSPAGTNVNFVQVQGDLLAVRTYERGVEDETLACGTGAVASALVAGRRGWLKPPVAVRVASGETLTVHFDPEAQDFGEVFLQGAACYVYQGVLRPEAFAWLDSAS